MLSRIDDIIFPNRCEVIEIEASQRYIYPIFKNGYTSLSGYAQAQKYKILFNEQIEKLTDINIIIRNPRERFISGINTYVYNTKRDNPHLDLNTIIYFAENYLFLDRHYAPQFNWLVNLTRYANKTTTKLHLHGIDSLKEFTPLVLKPNETKILSAEVIDRLKNNIHNEMYLRIDNLLLSLVGKALTFEEILKYLKEKDPKACEHVLS
jgi:hypothetical protein